MREFFRGARQRQTNAPHAFDLLIALIRVLWFGHSFQRQSRTSGANRVNAISLELLFQADFQSEIALRQTVRAGDPNKDFVRVSNRIEPDRSRTCLSLTSLRIIPFMVGFAAHTGSQVLRQNYSVRRDLIAVDTQVCTGVPGLDRNGHDRMWWQIRHKKDVIPRELRVLRRGETSV